MTLATKEFYSQVWRRRLVPSFYAHAHLFPSEWSQMKHSVAAHPLFHTVAVSVNAGDDADKSYGTQCLSLLSHLVAGRKRVVFSRAGASHLLGTRRLLPDVASDVLSGTRRRRLCGLPCVLFIYPDVMFTQFVGVMVGGHDVKQNHVKDTCKARITRTESTLSHSESASSKHRPRSRPVLDEHGPKTKHASAQCALNIAT